MCKINTEVYGFAYLDKDRKMKLRKTFWEIKLLQLCPFPKIRVLGATKICEM